MDMYSNEKQLLKLYDDYIDARWAKCWTKADAIRDELKEIGYVVSISKYNKVSIEPHHIIDKKTTIVIQGSQLGLNRTYPKPRVQDFEEFEDTLIETKYDEPDGYVLFLLHDRYSNIRASITDRARIEHQIKRGLLSEDKLKPYKWLDDRLKDRHYREALDNCIKWHEEIASRE